MYQSEILLKVKTVLLKMNNKQKLILVIGVVIIAAVFFFPPFIRSVPSALRVSDHLLSEMGGYLDIPDWSRTIGLMVIVAVATAVGFLVTTDKTENE